VRDGDVTKCANIVSTSDPEKLHLSQSYSWPLPEQQQGSHWSLDQGNYSLMACFIPDGLLQVALSFMKELWTRVRIPVDVYVNLMHSW